jgi:hypothetical protein
MMADYGIKEYFTRSWDYFSSWIEGPAIAQTFHEDLKLEITAENTRICESNPN